MSFCSFSTFQSSMQQGKLLIPGPPTNIISTVIDSSSIRVAFTAPNEIITSYTVKSSPGNLTGTGSTSPITVFGLTTNTAYTFTVTATSSFGTSTASNASSSKTTLTIAPTITTATVTDTSSVSVAFTPFSGSTTTAGLYFTIYDGYFADSMTFTSTSALKTTGLLASSTGYNSNISDINVGTNGAVPLNGSLETYTVEWIGLFLANVTGTWTFFTSSDDGSFLWIGANATSGYTTTNATVQNGGIHPVQERSGTVVLTSGVYYPIRILFGENTASDSMTVSFTPPAGTKTTNGTGYYYNPTFSYNVTSSPGSLTSSGLTSPITVSGLSGNTTYTFTITATNSGGTSVSSSASTSITTLPIYTFRVKSTTSVVPTTVDGYTLSNTSVTMVNDATRGYVFSFGTNKSLSINLATPLNSTKTFWLSSSTPQNSDGNVFSTAKMPIYFNSTTLLKATVNFGGSPVANVVSTIAQTITWRFYAITTTATTTTMYINGNVVASASVAWTGDASGMYFGSFTTGVNNYTGSMDDIRFYSLILTPTEIQTLYTITLL